MSSVAGPSRPTVRSTSARAHDEEADLLDLAARLSLADVDELIGQHKGKAREGAPLSDAEIALNLFAEDARSMSLFNSDRALARSLGQEEEEVFSARLQTPPTRAPDQRQRPTRPPVARPATTAQKTQTWSQWFSSTAQSLFSNWGSSSLPPVSAPAQHFPQNRLTGHTCVICQDAIRGPEIRAPCSHHYDKACVTDLFESATRDESLFPPRCCRLNIPLADVQPLLTPALIKLFKEKQIEFGTLKRVYCATPTCSQFLGPQSDGWFTQTFLCKRPGCTTRTCGRCKTKVEGAHTCAVDETDRAVMGLGAREGWARCPGCNRMIELNLGCNHMTCICKTQFCYVCKARWKTCTCPQWDEARLLTAAEQRVDFQRGLGVPERRQAAQNAPLPLPPRRAPALAAANRPQVHVAQPPAAAPHNDPRSDIVRPAPPAPRYETRPADIARRVNALSMRGAKRRASVPQGRAVPPLPAITVSLPANGTPGKRGSWRQTSDDDVPALEDTAAPRRDVRPGAARSSSSTTNDEVSAVHDTASQHRRPGRGRNHLNKSPRPPPWLRPIADVDEERQRLIREAMDHLRENHECEHSVWRYRHGGGHCVTCNDHLPKYLLRCAGCNLLACRRCRQNRL